MFTIEMTVNKACGVNRSITVSCEIRMGDALCSGSVSKVSAAPLAPKPAQMGKSVPTLGTDLEPVYKAVAMAL